MSDRIPEGDLVFPALDCLYDSPTGRVSTTKLRQYLTDTLSPKGEDTDILVGRNDMKFDQKVRNLKSHHTLEKTGYATANRGGFEITAAGRKMVERLRK
jgi:hypothetical protein